MSEHTDKLIAAHDGQVIWGTGVDEESALQDAREWMGLNLDPDIERPVAEAELQYDRMTQRLADHVAAHGFDAGRESILGGCYDDEGRSAIDGAWMPR